MAFDAKVNFVDPMFQVRLWDTIIYNYLKKRNIVVPQMDRSDKDSKFAEDAMSRNRFQESMIGLLLDPQ